MVYILPEVESDGNLLQLVSPDGLIDVPGHCYQSSLLPGDCYQLGRVDWSRGVVSVSISHSQGERGGEGRSRLIGRQTDRLH